MLPWTPIVDRDHVAVVVIRHGQTAWNAEGRFLGLTDLPLNPTGTEQARRLAPWRGRFDRVVSSPLLRALQTAHVLQDTPEQVAALAELDQGDLEGEVASDAMSAHPEFFKAWSADPSSVRIPGGGSLLELRDGAFAAISQLAAETPPGGVIAVVSHQLVLASVMATASGAPLGKWRDYCLPNVGAALLSWTGSRLALEASGIQPGFSDGPV